jgi:hypothetical protein
MFKEWMSSLYPPKRQASESAGAWVVKFPKQGLETVAAEDLTASKLRSLLENHALALHFEGSEEKLREHLASLAPSESLNLENWRVIYGGDNSKIVQVKLKGDREIRRLVRLIHSPL